MRVKRYVVDSMPDALQRIRVELGKDAVILNTKEIKTGGFLGLFGKKKIEVIAAMDTAQPAPKPIRPASVTPQAAAVPASPIQPIPSIVNDAPTVQETPQLPQKL